MLVSGWQQALTLVAVLVPGFVFQGVKKARVGPSPEDRDLSARLIRALALSVGFLLVYVLCLGDALTKRLTQTEHRFDDSRLVGFVGFLLVFVIPALVGHVTASFVVRQSYNDTRFWRTIFHFADSTVGELSWRKTLFSSDSNYSPIPTAWDYATGKVAPNSFVRVLNAGGSWIGGCVTTEAFFTGYPEPRDIYIDRAWSMEADGEFVEELPGPTGVWIPCSDAALVQIIAPTPEVEESDEDGE
ncbi:DUF6338 family protein [Rhodococcus ruber]|uniref:DUF6338 family protein n=1 Tax=Rhodococcus ruber TaxID=1830 RepID=A0ABT4M7M1_9NOCA|nr:DUF6338 family protein [Rhodococcus ruber]MCZ4516941.1 DUF6338 family protein [Rhodococcus ruber]